jgi:hypothetical protein
MIMEQTYKVGRGIAAMTAEEMGAQLEGNAGAIPAEYAEEVQEILDEVKAKLVGHVEKNVRKAMQHNGNGNGAAPLEGEVTLATGYEFWDLLTFSPQQLIAPPVTFRPQKIVAGGEPALLLAVLFINPLPTPFGGPSATQYLGGRPFRVRLEQVDLTNVADVPGITFAGVFPGVAPVISIFPAFVVPPNPGLNPQLVELNATADITTPGQPMAAFASQWLDLEADPGFPIPRPAGFRSQIPLRYLVYPR